MGRASLWGLPQYRVGSPADNGPLLILGWWHRVCFVAEYPVSVSLVNTQIYGALNHPRGEYCQLRTLKTQIQLNTNRDRSSTKKDSIQIYAAKHRVIQTANGGVSLQLRRSISIIHNSSFSARPETNKKRHHRLDNTLAQPPWCHFKQGTLQRSIWSLVIFILLYDNSIM